MWMVLLISTTGFTMAGAVLSGLAQSDFFAEEGNRVTAKVLMGGTVLCITLAILCMLAFFSSVFKGDLAPKSDEAIRCNTANGTYSLETQKCYREGKELIFDGAYEHI